MAIVLVDQFPGVDASDKAKNALASRLSGGLLVGPTILDFRGLDGAQDWTLDPTSALNLTDRTAVVWYWGPNTFRMTKAITIPPNGPYGAAATGASVRILPHHYHVFQGTTFIMQNSSGVRVLGTHLFLPYLDNSLATANATNGSSVITVTSTAGIEVGTPISLPGHLPRTGADTTTLTADPGSGGTTLSVVSTALFPPDNSNNAATVLIGSEIIRYTSKDATHLLGCTRGAYGTTGASHAVGSLVSRVVADTYYVKSIAGTQLTLDHAVGVTGTAVPVYQGTQDVSLIGSAAFDGNLDPGTDDTGNPSAVFAMGGRLIRVAPTIVVKNWDHGGFSSHGGQDHAIRGTFINNGRPTIPLGAHIWLFAGAKRCIVDADVIDGASGVVVDDRSTTGTMFDNSTDDNTVHVRSHNAYLAAALDGGAFRNTITIEHAVGATAAASFLAAYGSNQWGSVPAAKNNHIAILSTSPAVAAVSIAGGSGWPDNQNSIVCRVPGTVLGGTCRGLSVYKAQGHVALAYTPANIATDASLGDTFQLTITDASAFKVLNPSNLVYGGVYRWMFYNATGATRTGITWDTLFKPTNPNPSIGPSKVQIWAFEYDGTYLHQIGPTPIDTG